MVEQLSTMRETTFKGSLVCPAPIFEVLMEIRQEVLDGESGLTPYEEGVMDGIQIALDPFLALLAAAEAVKYSGAKLDSDTQSGLDIASHQAIDFYEGLK